MTSRLSPRLFLAALLWLATSLMNANPPRLPDALIHAAAALALGALLLDLAQRFRARGLYGLIALAGVYGLSAAMLFEPPVSAAELPRLLVARGLGTQTLIGLLALLIWLAALRGRSVGTALIAAGAAGVLALIDSGGALSTGTILLAALLVVIAGIARRLTAQAAPAALALSWQGRGLVALALLALAAYRLSSGALDPLTLALAVGLLAFVVALLWFQRRKREVSLLEGALPAAPPRAGWLLIPLALIAGAAIGAALATHTPLRNGVEAAMTAFGIVWLPAMSFTIGARALLRQVSAEQL